MCVLCKIFQKYIKNQSITNFMIILMTYYFLVSMVFARGIIHSIADLSCQKNIKNLWTKAMNLVFFLTDIKSMFDCIDHKLLIAKLFWYWVSPSPLSFIFSYLSNQTQHVKIKTSYSDNSSIKYGVPQGSILGSLLFNMI